MNLQVDVERLSLARKALRAELLAERTPDGRWLGHLPSSPFATATAISALVLGHRRGTAEALRETNTSGGGHLAQQIVQGDLCELLLESVHWLARHQNLDGGWGDCERAQSNLVATLLVQAAFRLTGIPAKYADLMVRADQYIAAQGGIAGLWQYDHEKALVAAVLANAALADMVTWRQVPALGFEMACMPQRWRRQFPASASPPLMPLFVAVGRAKAHHDPPRNPITRLLRHGCRAASLSVLEKFQAIDGSFADSPAITSLVVMNLASIGFQEHPLVERGIEFLLSSIQPDASWRAENNLAIWNTTLAVNNLVGEPCAPATLRNSAAAARPGSAVEIANARDQPVGAWYDTARVASGEAETFAVETARQPSLDSPSEELGEDEMILDERCLNWLLACQRTQHDSALDIPPGGWGRSDSPSSLPTTIDTASTLLALVRWQRRFAELQNARIRDAAVLGLGWLLDLQHENGGWPTFPNTAGSIPTDENGTDATAWVLRALAAWQNHWQLQPIAGDAVSHMLLERSLQTAIELGLRYLASQQRDDASFVPHWFGNEHQPRHENPVFGTAQVLFAYADLHLLESEVALRAARWMVAAQHANGGWGPPRAPLHYSGAEKDGFRAWRANDALAKFASVEETALAVSALLPFAEASQSIARSVAGGLSWLAGAVEQDAHRHGAVIGFYPTKLWYHERLYPLVFAAGALASALRRFEASRHAVAHVS